MLVRTASVVDTYVVQVIKRYLHCSKWSVVNVSTLSYSAVPVTYYVELMTWVVVVWVKVMV